MTQEEHDAECWRMVKKTASEMMGNPNSTAESRGLAAGFLAFLVQAEAIIGGQNGTRKP